MIVAVAVIATVQNIAQTVIKSYIGRVEVAMRRPTRAISNDSRIRASTLETLTSAVMTVNRIILTFI